MRLLIVLLLAGCAHVPNFTVEGKEPACARQCTGQYSTCASGSGGTYNGFVARELMDGCEHATTQCLNTCPNI